MKLNFRVNCSTRFQFKNSMAVFLVRVFVNHVSLLFRESNRDNGFLNCREGTHAKNSTSRMKVHLGS